MGEREYVWSDEGLTDAARNKVDLDEAEQALHARPLAGVELDEWRRHVL